MIDGADKQSEGAKSIKNGVGLSVLARRADEGGVGCVMWCVVICFKGRPGRGGPERSASAKHADETLLGASAGGARQVASCQLEAARSHRRVLAAKNVGVKPGSTQTTAIDKTRDTKLAWGDWKRPGLEDSVDL